MRVCIHRGASQIGGSLVELESHNQRLVLDAGLPLDAGDVPRRDLLPDVPGLWERGDGSLQALVISHAHPDHYGLADLVHADVPILLGEAAAAILSEAAFFVRSSRGFPVAAHLRHRQTHELGPFRVTPWLVDHSAYDAYALLVEADGRRLLYSGDVRAHGRKAASLDGLAREVGPVDLLLLEGTRVHEPAGIRSALTEADVERECARLFARTDGMALAFYSPQNVDRLVSLYRAAKRSGRIFVMDLYAASICAATRRSTIPQAAWDGVRVYLPRTQRRRVIDEQAYHRVDAVRPRRIYADELRDRADEMVMTCRASMMAELERADCLERAGGVWSMWAGYLNEPPGRSLADRLQRLNIDLRVVHSSGHATTDCLEDFAASVGPKRLVPIHTAFPEHFEKMFRAVELHDDGGWWSA